MDRLVALFCEYAEESGYPIVFAASISLGLAALVVLLLQFVSAEDRDFLQSKGIGTQRSGRRCFLMTNRKSQPFTPEEDDKIRAFVANGASAFRAGAAMKRSRLSLQSRARKLGCPFVTVTEMRRKTFGVADAASWGYRHAKPAGNG